MSEQLRVFGVRLHWRGRCRLDAFASLLVGGGRGGHRLDTLSVLFGCYGLIPSTSKQTTALRLEHLQKEVGELAARRALCEPPWAAQWCPLSLLFWVQSSLVKKPTQKKGALKKMLTGLPSLPSCNPHKNRKSQSCLSEDRVRS